jgi:hypothetical protein
MGHNAILGPRRGRQLFQVGIEEFTVTECRDHLSE